MAPGGGGREERRRVVLLLLVTSRWLYGALLALYPRAFRERYAEEMRQDFADLSREGLEEGGRAELVRVWGGAFLDLALTALQERGTAMSRNALLPVEPRAAARALVAVVLVAVTVTAASLVKTPQYEASSKLLIGQERNLEGAGLEVCVNCWSPSTRALAAATHSRPIAEETIERLNLPTTPDAFLDHLEAEPIENTQFVKLSYTDPNPQKAQVVTNTVGEVLSRRASEAGLDGGDVTAMLWERAAVPEEPVSPNPLRNGFLALVAGLLVFVGLAFASPVVAASGIGRAARRATSVVGRTPRATGDTRLAARYGSRQGERTAGSAPPSWEADGGGGGARDHAHGGGGRPDALVVGGQGPPGGHGRARQAALLPVGRRCSPMRGFKRPPVGDQYRGQRSSQR